MKIVSIDIGLKNFAIVMEENSKILFMESFDLTSIPMNEHTYEEKYHTIYAMNAILENIKDKWIDSDFILIEQQGVFGNIAREYNLQTIKLQYQCIQYFIYMKYTQQATYTLDCVPSRLKTTIFKMDNSKKNTKYNRKQWSIEKVTDLLKDDVVILNKIKSMKKKDDVCDAYLQLQAYKIQHELK